MKHELTILSHHKCATNWLRGICQHLVDEKIINVEIKGGRQSKVNADTIIAAKNVFLDVNATKHAASLMRPEKNRNIHFVRDPRDALVSNYFSWIYSHTNNDETILKFREAAPNMSVEDGMILLLDDFPMGKQLETWTDNMWDNTTIIKYENMLSNFDETFPMMFEAISLPLDEALVARIKEATSFQKMSGRPSGQEDKTKHFRKGKAGDSQEYFTERLNGAFMEKYNWIGDKLGYQY